MDSRTTPLVVRISFLVFTAALIATGVALISHTPTIVPWALRAESSVIFGWAFLGAACYFLYGAIVPPLDNAGGQLLGFLGYDLILIVPFLVTADGQVVENPRHHRRGEKKLAKCQRRVSKRKQGSHRRRKAVRCLQRAHQHAQRQRLDFHHKTALWLLKLSDIIHLEDLRVANMLKNRSLAKSSNDACGLGTVPRHP